MKKTEILDICINILSAEVEKIAKKYTEIDNRINEDITLTPKKFDTLDKKRSKLQENMQILYYGINTLENEKYIQKRIEERKVNQ